MKAWFKDQKNWRWEFRHFKSKTGEFWIQAGWSLDNLARVVVVGIRIRTHNHFLLIGASKPVRKR